MEHLDALKDALSRAEAKEKRLLAQLESVQKERVEFETALRVFERLANPASSAPTNSGQGENGQLIYSFVGVGVKNALLPKEIIDNMKAQGHDLGDDLVRTQLWRMSKRGELEKLGGRYFRTIWADSSVTDADGHKAPDASAAEALKVGRVAELEGPEKTEQHPFRKGENVGSSPTPPAFTKPTQSDDWDFNDDDIPF